MGHARPPRRWFDARSGLGRSPGREPRVVRVEERQVETVAAERENAVRQLACSVVVEHEEIEDRGVRVGGRIDAPSAGDHRRDGHDATVGRTPSATVRPSPKVSIHPGRTKGGAPT